MVVFPDEPTTISSKYLTFFAKVKLSTLNAMFDKGLQIGDLVFSCYADPDSLLVLQMPTKRLEFFLNSTNGLRTLTQFSLNFIFKSREKEISANLDGDSMWC